MSKNFVALLLVALLGGGGFLFFKKYEVVGLEHISVRPREASAADVSPDANPDADSSAGDSHSSLKLPLPPAHKGETIRIASFNIQVFGQSKLNKPMVMQDLAKVVRQFDVVAIQEIRSKEPVLPRFIELINSTGQHNYGYVIGERLGRTSSKEQYAFVYDRATIEVDESSMYTVPGLSKQLHRPPFVALFRARGPPAEEAFTFQLINIHTDPDDTKIELNALDDAYRFVRDHLAPGQNRKEDDVILLGDLNVDERHLGQVAELPYIKWMVTGETKTNTRQNKQYDNIVYNQRATIEFTGRSGVFNLMSELGRSSAEALKISDHMPVWAEFSVYENGRAGRVATRREAAETR